MLSRQRRTFRTFTGDDDLDAALSVIGSFSQAIVQADIKTGLALSGLGVVGTGSLAESSVWLSGGVPAWSLVFPAVLVTSMGLALIFLGSALWPRLDVPAGGANRFAFPCFDVNAQACSRPELARQAWREAAVLAKIAQTKHRRFRQALPWTCLALLAAAGHDLGQWLFVDQ